ncbi:hypothetical protein GJ629_00190 [Halapricum sp. CBA1109]|uniref:hypothetical protein n=1 Tax=Halapricum sp. CBA1109 TaxID=2668068 RepID=UPI0012F837C6|nr:hypothetical protein [Halapricum sp. CBA1109]MUV88495.1 hypothetical protein [Halapricum sp. CBA1109]
MAGSLAQGPAANQSSPTIPEPEPGVERTYNDTYRILASEDEDPLFNTSTLRVPVFHDDGSLTYENETFGIFPVQLDPRSLRPSDALLVAYETDVYQTSLYDKSGTIPHRDTWVPLDEYSHLRTSIIQLSNVTALEPTSISGNYRVEALNHLGYWHPVYNADVQEDDSPDGYFVANPSSAIVHVPTGEWVSTRRWKAVKELLRYSEDADPAVARERVAIPMEEGEELYPVSNGGSINRQWQRPTNVVRDTYVGIADVPPAAWYRGRYVTRDWDTTAAVPWDYRLEIPDEYSVSDTCRHVHTINNSTVIHNHPRTKWAEYTLESHDAVVDVWIGNGSYTADMNLQFSSGMWALGQPYMSWKPSLSAGAYEITAEVNVTASVLERYGITSAECTSYDRERFQNVTHVVSYSVPVQIVDDESAALQIDATYYDRRGDDIIHIEWSGNQTLAAAPWQQITATFGNTRLHLGSPWRFYPVSQSDAVEERSANETTTISSGHSFSDTYPRLLRNRVAVGNVSLYLDEPANESSWWRGDYAEINRIVPGTSLPSTIIAPDNARPSPLYDEVAGYVETLDRELGEDVEFRATTIFEKEIGGTSLSVVPYRDAKITVWIDDSSGTDVLQMQLTDAQSGAPLAGRELSLTGASESNVTTDSSGMATAVPQGSVVRATFEGDPWQSSRTTYYMEDTAAVMTGFAASAALNDFFGYLNIGVSNTVLLIEWVALAILSIWWIRRNKDT